MIDCEKDQISSQIISRLSSTSFKEETHDSEKNTLEDNNSKQDLNTSFGEDLEDFSIRNLTCLIHEFHRAQNSINSHSHQKKEQHEHQTLSYLDSYIQLPSPFSEKLSEY
jgi:hypothetical protein